MEKRQIEFVELASIEAQQVIDLMNNPLVRRQMPLLQGEFGKEEYRAFIDAKAKLWKEQGFGPQAFLVDGQFAGWGGLQPENGEVDLALVLHPKFWGLGKRIYQILIEQAFETMNLTSVTVLFPPGRTRIQGFLRLGFQAEDEVEISGTQFVRYRLSRQVFTPSESLAEDSED